MNSKIILEQILKDLQGMKELKEKSLKVALDEKIKGYDFLYQKLLKGINNEKLRSA